MSRGLRAALLPLIIGAALVALGHRLGWLVLIMALARYQLAYAAPAADAAVDRGIRQVVRAVGHAFTAVLFVVPALLAVLVGVVGRLVGSDPLHRTTGWSPVPSADGSGAERSRGRTPRLALAATAIILLAATTVWVVRDRSSAGTGKTVSAIVPRAEALQGQEDIDEVLEEEGAVFRSYQPDPVVGWNLPERFDGSAVSVEDHRRTTVQAADRGPLVWLFGGSTMFGSNQRDDRTIASRFAAISTANGRPVRVVNWGRHAFTAYQQAQLLQHELRRADELPDLVVFYDGFNDVAVGVGTSLLEGPSTEPPRAPSIAEGSPAEPSRGRPRWMTPAQRYDQIAADYRKAGDLARRAAAAHGIDVVRVWQPSAFTRRPLTRGERVQLARLGIDDQALQTLRTAHEEVGRRLPPSVIDLSGALDDAPTVFVDEVHTNERGAELVAEALESALAGRVRDLEP
ncbi:MAG TPA: SGNH/GDSL hydrolase family protein [Acidimicrobiales bacterium]|nr:SGNH/GDSL hydrolase family protein [Acidimicrobiales bacterium]